MTRVTTNRGRLTRTRALSPVGSASRRRETLTDGLEFLYVIRARRLQMVTEAPTLEEEEILSRHVAYLEDLTEEGIVVLYGRTQNRDESTFGIVVFRARDESEARQIMANDPAVQEGIMQAELYPYRIAMMGRPEYLP